MNTGELRKWRAAVRVLVTGAAGTIGRVVVTELTSRGYEVVALDLAPLRPSPGVVRTVRADVTATDQMRPAVEDCTAVVHLAGYIEPGAAHPEVVFGANAAGAFTVLQALADAGGDRAVLASSASALGMAWAPVPTSPDYVPVDEDHPVRPADPYGLSKEVVERTGAMFHRRYGMSVAALRFPWAPGDAERAERLAKVAADPGHEPAVRDLWGYVHPRDVARACALALAADRVALGFEVFTIAAADTISDIPTRELLARYHPDTPVRADIAGTGSAWSAAKAHRLLGYTPAHSWRDGR